MAVAGSEQSTERPGAVSTPPAGWRNLAALAVVLVGLLVVGFFVLKPAPAGGGDPRTAAPEQGHVAPLFSLESTAGQTVDLGGLRGHPVVLNFWFTNCPPCRSEMPDLQRAYSALRSRGVVILGVDAVGEDAATIRAFADPLGITYPLLVDASQHVTVLYRVSTTPSTFFIDRRGMIRLTHTGPLTASVVQNGLKGL